MSRTAYCKENFYRIAETLTIDELFIKHKIASQPGHECIGECFVCVCSEVYRDLKACEEVIIDMKLEQASEYIETIGGAD